MATIKLKGDTIHTAGELPKKGTVTPDFSLIKTDLSSAKLSDFKGKRVILNIFPSIDTNVCATSVRKFNEKATQLKNTEVLCISRDLPFAQTRFSKDHKTTNVTYLSDYQDQQFGKDYGLEIIDGPFKGLLSRVVIVLDENAKVIYTEQVADIVEEPDYLSALKTLL